MKGRCRAAAFFLSPQRFHQSIRCQLPGPEDADPGTGLVPLGDMVISMEHVAAQAKEYGHSNRRELAYLVVHSVLHLLGYDHLDEGPQKKQMRAREEAILAELGITRED